MPLSAEVVSRLVGTIYEAAASPALWLTFIEQVKAAGEADKAFLLLNTSGPYDFSIHSGCDERSLRAYEAHFFERDVLVRGYVGRVVQHGEWVGDDRSVIRRADLLASELFNDFMTPNGDAHQCGNAMGGMAYGGSAGLSLLRSAARGEFGEETVGLVAMLTPHIKRALELHRSLSRLRDENADIRHTVEAAGIAAVSLGEGGRVVRMTAAARRLLEAREGLEVSGGRLVAADARERGRLEELIRGAAATGGGGEGRAVALDRAISPQVPGRLHTLPFGGAMLVSRRPPKRPLQVVVSPFRSVKILLEDRPCAVLLIRDPEERPGSQAELLRSLYGLSPMEGRVAGLLVAGVDVAGIAEQLGISTETVRFYLKAIFRKTGTRRQSELVRLAMGLPGAGR
jgi:DNA-binding CsgD family transcriptional regulator